MALHRTAPLAREGRIHLLRCQDPARILPLDSTMSSDSSIARPEESMRWEKPTYKDLRFGFEVTMYIYNR